MRLLIAGLLLAGCAGEPDTVDPVEPSRPAFGRRLTHSEVFNSIEVALGVTLAPADFDLPVDIRAPAGFRNSAADLFVSPARVEAYDAIAAAAAAQADLDAFGACRDPTPACRDAFVAAAGLRLLRHPLPDVERAIFLGLFEGEAAFDDGARLVLRSMLQSPRFVYRLEVPAGDVDAYERATRLAFLIWNAGPDALLLEAAANGTLDLRAEAERLLAHPRARRAFRQYLEQWLYLDAIPETVTLGAVMKEETYRLFERLVWEEQADLMRAFVEERTEIPPELAELYALELEADGVYDLSAVPERIGFLTNAAVLTARTFNPESSMIDRGLFVLNDLLCETVPPPEGAELRAAIEAARVPVESGLSQRDRFAMQSEDPLCASCHARFDPLGLPFETFGPTGRHLTEDVFGNPLSGMGSIDTGALSGTYDGIEDFAKLLGGSEAVARCLVEKSMQHALGRRLGAADQPALDDNFRRFSAAGRTYQSLISAIATHPDFGAGEETP